MAAPRIRFPVNVARARLGYAFLATPAIFCVALVDQKLFSLLLIFLGGVYLSKLQAQLSYEKAKEK